MDIREFRADDTVAVIALWQACGLTRPWNEPQKDIDRKVSVDPDGFLVGEVDGEVIASLMVGYEGHRGWVNYLAVDLAHQKSGFGRELMAAAEAILISRGCPKINLQIRTSNAAVLAFYARLGYLADDVVSLGKRLIVD